MFTKEDRKIFKSPLLLFFKMKFDKYLSTIHGYLCGDGYVSTNLPHQKHKYYSIGFRNTNFTLLKDFQDNFYQFFKIRTKLIKGQRCLLYSKELYFKLMEEGPYHSNNWKFPALSKENVKYWLRAFFDCEAWIIADQRKTRSICLESVRREKLPDIQQALKKFGINSKIYTHKNRTTSILTIPDKDSIVNFGKEIGFLHPEKNKKLCQAINSFVDYKWNFTNINLRRFIRKKAKIKKPYIIRIFSIEKANLEKLAKLIFDSFGIESKLYEDKNGFGNYYHYLSIHKKNEIKKMIENALLSRRDISKIEKAFKSKD